MRSKIFVLAFLLVFAVSLPAVCGEKATVDLNGGVYKTYGNTTYNINFMDDYGYAGASELEFPIDTWFTKLGVHAKLLKRLDLSLDYAWSADDEAGTFTDKDWSDYLSNYYGFNDYYIYGEGDASIDATEWNFDAKFDLAEVTVDNAIMDKVKLIVGGGYKEQKFEYMVNDIVQSSSYFYGLDYVGVGDALDYSVEYKAFYLSMYVDMLSSINKMDLLLGAEYAPNMDAEDSDDHLLRYKKSESSGDGTYYKLAAQLNWNVWSNIYASAYYNYISMEASGSQDQWYYGGPYAGWTASDIDWDTESMQNVWGAKFTWMFD
jgi:hypothetical protein